MHVVTHLPEPFLAMNGMLRVHAIPAATTNLVWLAECTTTGNCVVIDGPDATGALDQVTALGLSLVGVLTTHTHADHIGLHRDLDRRGLLSGLRVFGAANRGIPGLNEPVDDGDTVAFGQLNGQVLRTEGHQDGHLSYLFGDVLFCGDTLFTGGCGYLFDGPPAKLFHSLLRLAALPGNTKVCCAHDYTFDNLQFALSVEPSNPALVERMAQVTELRALGRCTVPSTIEQECATNPFLRPGSPQIIEQVSRQTGMPLGDPLAVFTATRALKDTGRYRQASAAVTGRA